jgi:hypothetical protein
MVVNTTNIYSESRAILKKLIDDNVVDPKKARINSPRRWIYREQPDTTSSDFEGYPIIIITSPDLDDDVQDLQDSLSDGTLGFEISVQAEFNDVNARVDEISSQIYGLFRNLAKTKDLANNNLYKPKVTSSPFSNTDEAGKRLSGRVLLVEFSSTLEGGVYE